MKECADGGRMSDEHAFPVLSSMNSSLRTDRTPLNSRKVLEKAETCLHEEQVRQQGRLQADACWKAKG